MKFAILPFFHLKQKKTHYKHNNEAHCAEDIMAGHSNLKTYHFCYTLPLSLSTTPTLVFYSNKVTHIQSTAWPTIPFISASLCNVTLHTYTPDCHLFPAMFRALHLHITQHLLAPAATLSKNISAAIIYMKPPTFCTAYLKPRCRWHLQIHTKQHHQHNHNGTWTTHWRQPKPWWANEKEEVHKNGLLCLKTRTKRLLSLSNCRLVEALVWTILMEALHYEL